MYTTIRQGDPESLRSHPPRNQLGFTLPELLVSLAILLLSMQVLVNLSLLIQGSHGYLAENRQALLLAEEIHGGLVADGDANWIVEEEKIPMGKGLQEHRVRVHKGTRSWSYYYVEKAIE